MKRFLAVFSLIALMVMVCPLAMFDLTVNAQVTEVQTNLAVAADHVHNFGRRVNSVAHRGYSLSAPENTLPAYRLAKEKGFFYVECDVTYTRDGVPVLNHLAHINDNSNGSGNISQYTYAQLLQFDFGSWKGQAYKGTKIATFEEFVALCAQLGLHPYIELKDHGGHTQEKIQDLVNILKKYDMLRQCTWITFIHDYFFYVNNCDPYARMGLLWPNDVNTQLINKALSIKTPDNEVFLNVSIDNLTSSGIQRAKTNGFPVEVYTINSENKIRTMNEYISGVTSDWIIAQSLLGTPNCVVTPATCTTQGYSTYSCLECGYKQVDELVRPIAHQFAQDDCCIVCGAMRELSGNTCKHSYDYPCDNDCNNCGEIRIVDGHLYDNEADADCNFCGEMRKLYLDRQDGCVLYPALDSGTVNGNVGVHTLQNCVAPHQTRLYTYNTYKVKEVYQVVVGDECRVFVQFFNASGSYIGGSNWKTTGTYKISDLSSANSATYFKVTFSSTKGGNDLTTPPADRIHFVLSHTYDNSCDEDCNNCGQTRSGNHNYKWIVDEPANCVENGKRHSECSLCGKIINLNASIPATGSHVYDNYCDAKCNVCGNERTVAHNFVPADCINPETCKRCGITNGKALGHKYDNSDDIICNACSACKTLEPILFKENSVWYYYENGVKTNTTTLVKYKGKWFYVEDGIWTVKTTLVKYKDKWFYIKGGKWDKTITSLVKYSGKWFYIKNGKWSSSTKGIIEYKGKDFFIKGGKWDSSLDTLYKKDGQSHVIKNGKWYKEKAVFKYAGKKYYVNKGYAQLSYSGKVKINSKTYTVIKGIIK